MRLPPELFCEFLNSSSYAFAIFVGFSLFISRYFDDKHRSVKYSTADKNVVLSGDPKTSEASFNKIKEQATRSF